MNVISQLRVVLGLETAGFPQARQQVRGLTQGVQREFAQLKTFVAGFFTAQFGMELIRAGTQLASRFKDLSETSGESLKNVQRLDKAAEGVGKSFEDAAKGMDKFLQFAEEARTADTSEKMNLLRRYGLTKADLDALKEGTVTARQLIEKLFSGGGADASNPVARRDMAQIFGTKGAGSMIAIFRELREQGPITILGDDQIKRIDEAGKALERLKKHAAISTADASAGLLGWIDKGNLRKSVSRQAMAMSGDMSLSEEARATARDIALELRSFRGFFGTSAFQIREAQRALASLFPSTPAAAMFGPNTPGAPSRSGAIMAGLDGDPTGLAGKKKDARQSLVESIQGAIFGASNAEDRKGILRAQMEKFAADADALEKEGKASGKEDPGKVAELRRKAIAAGVSLSELTGDNPIGSPDSVARIGGRIGGAMGVDPSLTGREQLNVLKGILDKLGELSPAIKDAIKEAMTPQPIGRIRP